MMQSYVTNLDRCPDRWASMQQQARSFGISIERISAIEGARLSPQVLAKIRSGRSEFQPLDVGTIGLYLSHKIAWQRLLDSGDRYAAVFEDDVVLTPDIHQILSAIDHQRPACDLIKLETTLRKVVCARQIADLGCGHVLRPLLSWHGGSAGYVISRSAASRLLSEPLEVPGIIDQVLFHPFSRISSQLNIVQLVPAACVQTQFLPRSTHTVFESTLGKPRSRRRLTRFGLWIDAQRLVRKQLESLRRRVLTAQAANDSLVVPYCPAQLHRRAA